MTPGRPAGAATEPPGVILSPNKYPPAGGLLLEVALQAQNVIAFGQHSGVHRPVRFVAGRASLAHRFVFEDERAALRDVAVAPSVLVSRERRPPPDDGLSPMRIVTIGAADSPPGRHRLGVGTFEDGMCIRKTEFGPLVQMALEADFSLPYAHPVLE